MFVAAAAEGELEGLLVLLHFDVVVCGDGGGIVTMVCKLFVGAERVVCVVLALMHTIEGAPRIVDVNGMFGLFVVVFGLIIVILFMVDEGWIVEIDVICNPEKLKGVVL